LRQTVATFGRLDVVVNSAAVMERLALDEVTAAAWDRAMNLNLRAPFLIAQEAARLLPEGGSIINIADLAAFETWPAYIPLGVSKAGLVHLTRALARALAPRIRVNAVAPGMVLAPEWLEPDAAERFVATTPLRRAGSPEDVVQAIRYLLAATFVTGETILVDGGRHVRW
jgi:pteridine reductase